MVPSPADEPKLDTDTPQVARRYNYLAGGKDNFEADRRSGAAMLQLHPQVVIGVRENRAFMLRAVEQLAQQHGVRQFLDIGAGLPDPKGNAHEVAQRIDPKARVVYVDNDPLVLVHAVL